MHHTKDRPRVGIHREGDRNFAGRLTANCYSSCNVDLETVRYPLCREIEPASHKTHSLLALIC